MLWLVYGFLYVDSSIIERDGSLGLLLQFCTYVSRRARAQQAKMKGHCNCSFGLIFLKIVSNP